MALKIWNGRGGIVIDSGREPFKSWDATARAAGRRFAAHAYICAYSVRDAKVLIEQYLGYLPRGVDGEIRDYFSKGCWGNAMDGITPERGIWVTEDHDETPVRLI